MPATDKIKVTVEYTDFSGRKKQVESEYPANRKELLGNVLSVIGKFQDEETTYGFIFLKGEAHEKVKGALQPTVYAKVSPRLPQAEDFKKMLVRRVGSIWKDHMHWSSIGDGVKYKPTADLGRNHNYSDFVAKGKF